MNMDVAVLGPAGTYTHAAAERYFDEYDPRFESTLAAVFDADVPAVVPFENSIEGSVTETIDRLRTGGRRVTGEVVVPVEHCLITADDGPIETVRSHPQALAQCRGFVDENGYNTEETASTAAAVEGLAPGQAAIASKLAGTARGLTVRAESIQDVDTNVTRFYVLDGPADPGEKTSLLLDPREDRPGLLHSMLGCFSGHDVNLEYVQSRPAGDELGTYVFYVEAGVSEAAERFRLARQCLETYTDVEVLGSYRPADRN